MGEQVVAAIVGVMNPKPLASLNHLTVPLPLLPSLISLDMT